MHFCLSVRFVALGLLAAMVLSSCGAAETSEISMEKASVVQEDVPQEITVWLDGTYNNYMSVLVDYFQKEHPDIPVNVEDHSGMAPEEYRVFLEASLADGTGPDVVLLWNNGNETTD